jgi:anti-sigma regulatory factor (Ser/Thr protein kinase)
MDAIVSALLQPTSLAPGLARNWIEGLPVERSVARDLRLLTHEVVSNSVQHAGMGPKDPIRLNIFLGADHVRVEVWDRGPGFTAHPRPPSGSRERGMGLFVLDRLSNRWGVQRGECNCVWFEVDLVTKPVAKPPAELVRSQRLGARAPGLCNSGRDNLTVIHPGILGGPNGAGRAAR